MASSSQLASEQALALARLRSVAAVEPFYLAGDTAVAFHLGHRVSRDLDLFARDVDLQAVHASLVRELAEIEVLAITDATLQIRLKGIPIDLVRYAYAPLESPQIGPEGVLVAGRLDLAVMKLAAIAHRGLRRDFWDEHELLTRGGLQLDAVLDGYLRRFGKSEPDLYHVLRSLTFFDDTDREPIMPAGLSIAAWQVIRDYFLREAPAALQRRTSGAPGD